MMVVVFVLQIPPIMFWSLGWAAFGGDFFILSNEFFEKFLMTCLLNFTYKFFTNSSIDTCEYIDLGISLK